MTQELEIKKIHVTPALAAEWLTKNTDNYRKLRPAKVRELINALKQGTWKLTHQGIAFDVEGKLIDGQHRLTAIVESGVSADMFVSFNVGLDAVNVLDIGAKRQFSDVLARQGEHLSTLLASVVMRLWYWYNSETRVRDRNYIPTFEERLTFLEEHPNIRKSIITTQNVRATNTNLSMAHYIFGNIDADERDFFFENLLALECELDTNHPIMSLRRALDKMYTAQRRGQRASEDLQLAIIVKAWNAYRSRKSIAQLKFPSYEKKFPEPY